MAGQIAIDGGGDQRREVAGGEKMIRRPEEAEQVTRERMVSEKFPKFDPSVFITCPCQYDRVEQLGGTKIAESQAVAATRCDRSVQIGCTEMKT